MFSGLWLTALPDNSNCHDKKMFSFNDNNDDGGGADNDDDDNNCFVQKNVERPTFR